MLRTIWECSFVVIMSCMKLFVRPLNSLTKIFIRKNLGIFMLQIININDILGLPDYVFQ